LATISDVARAAGVSVATVSHVINATRPVLPDTRRKVLAAVDELAYRRDGVARSLRRAKTGTIGVMIADISNPFFAALVLGVEAAVHGADDPHTLILCNTEENAAKERLYLDVLQEKRVDGIIMAPVGPNGPACRRLIEAGLPIVCVDRVLEGLECDAVVLDNREAAGRVVRHLLAQGHRSIAMLRAAQWTDTMDSRAAGWRDALRAAGASTGPALVVTSESRIASAQVAALALLDLDPRPDAVFTTNNFMTLGLMQAMAERGLRCPDDLAIAGFDDFPWADAFHPRLTAVAQPAEQMGREAVALLFDRITKRHTGAPVRRVLTGDLMVRDSCGAGRRSLARGAA
jgi:LacI family transcriptional regulator